MSGNRFVKGRTNNHATWVMVDATDFATPESALSAATTIKIYGKVRGATGVNFVSSGTGSLTNDIQHVGASALGIYTIALVKADLSDASNAWYDQYTISLSGTGAARQTLIIDGGIDASALSANQSRLSDIQSYLVAMSGMLSDAHSAAILAASNASEAQSIALVVQSRLSDLESDYTSRLSDILSGVVALSDAVSNTYSATLLTQSLASDAASAAIQGNSRTLLVQSRLSELDSRLASEVSDVYSALVAMSDLVSGLYSQASDLHSNTISYLVGMSAMMSNIQSDLSDARSDIKSAIGNVTVVLNDSNISDIGSAVAAVIGGDISNIYSLLSDLNSNFGSRIPKEPAARSQLVALDSNLLSYLGVMSGVLSDVRSMTTANSDAISNVYSLLSDLHSDVGVASGVQSDIYSLLSDLHSDVGVMSGVVSDIYSGLSDVSSDLAVISGVLSDVHSATTVLQAGLAVRVKKNTALANFMFAMIDSTDDVSGKTGLTITATRSIDGAAFAACANSASEVSAGMYKINLAAADLNGDVITLRFVGSGANDTLITIVTQP